MSRFRRLVLLFSSLVCLAGCGAGSPPTPIVIGHVADKARLDKAGVQAEFGIRLALHDVSKGDALANDFGGRPINVRHTDTNGQLDAFESEAVRLDSFNRTVALIGGMTPAQTAALTTGKVPVLTLHGQTISVATNQVFYLGMSPARQGAVLAKVLAEDPKVKRVTVLLDDRRPESIALEESFQRVFAEARKSTKGSVDAVSVLRIVEGSSLKLPALDEERWHDLIERMINQEPHAVVFAGAVQDFNTWRKVLRKDFLDANPQIVFAGADGSQSPGGGFDRDANDKTPILMATAFHVDPKSEKISAFAKAFAEAFQTEPDVNAALAYDGLRILVDAMKRCGSQLGPDRLRDELLKVKDLDGLTGPLTVTADRHVQRPLFVVSWQNGAQKLVKKFAAD